MKPLATVLIDTYNHEKYIEQAILSALSQDVPSVDYEIVVVDDGSTDRTPEIVRKFAPRVRLLSKKNGGQASAFNAAIPELRGQVIAFLDGDDWFANGKLAAVMTALEREPTAAAIGHGYYEVHEGSQEARVCAPEQTNFLDLRTAESAREAFRNWCFLLMGALTVRRKILPQVMPIPESLVFCADAPIVIGAMVNGVRVLPEALFYYRHHSENLYSISPKDPAKLLRRHGITEKTFELVEPLLLRLGVAQESVAAGLYPPWVEHSRLGLRTLGGSRWDAFQTEMRAFRAEHWEPSLRYRLFKYLVVGAATFLLPPVRFYNMRDWYWNHKIGHIREHFAKTR